jgi:hypothetical protein
MSIRISHPAAATTFPYSAAAQQSRIQPEAIDDPLSELAREGARRMLAQVLIADLMHERRDIAASRARPNSVCVRD